MTLSNSVAAATFSGVGLHTGQDASVAIRRAHDGSGKVFRRLDMKGGAEIPALASHVSSTVHRTELENGKANVATVEHLLAAAHVLGIDDIYIDVTGPEIPIADGSAAPFVDLLSRSDLPRTTETREPLNITSSVELSLKKSRYLVEPASNFRVTVEIGVPHPLIGQQALTLDIEESTFISEIAPARTFGYLDDYERLKQIGLARGADTSNVLVLTEDGLLEGSLYWPDEFVRHKALDLIGDLALVGRPMRAHVVASDPGHAGNVALARALYASAPQKVEA